MMVNGGNGRKGPSLDKLGTSKGPKRGRWPVKAHEVWEGREDRRP